MKILLFALSETGARWKDFSLIVTRLEFKRITLAAGQGTG